MNEYKLTRVNVTVDINREKYEAAGGSFGLPWDKFDKTFMPHMPDNYSAVIAHPDLTNGKTSVKATLDLSPVERALDRKKVRFPGDENIDFSRQHGYNQCYCKESEQLFQATHPLCSAGS